MLPIENFRFSCWVIKQRTHGHRIPGHLTERHQCGLPTQASSHYRAAVAKRRWLRSGAELVKGLLWIKNSSFVSSCAAPGLCELGSSSRD